MKKNNIQRPPEKWVDEDLRRFDRWYRPCHPDLTLYCLGWVKDVALAEKIAADVLTRLYRLQDPGTLQSVENWLFTTAKRGCLSYISRGRPTQALGPGPISASNPEQTADHVSYDLLSNLHGGKASLGESEAILSHLHACERCTMVFQGLSENPVGRDWLTNTERILRERTASGDLRPRRGAVKGGWMLKVSVVLFVAALGLLVWKTLPAGGPSTDARVEELLVMPHEAAPIHPDTSATDRMRNSARRYYVQGLYADASAVYDSVVTSSGAPEDRFFFALSTLYAGGNIEMAIRELGALERAGSGYEQSARWWLSLALWKNGDSIGARDYWQRISQARDHYMVVPAQELLDLSE